MKKFATNLFCGAASLLTLYLTAKVSFRAGQEYNRVETAYTEMAKNLPTPEQSNSEISPIVKKTSLLERIKPSKVSMLKSLIKDPDAHKVEASVENGEMIIKIKKNAT